MENEFTIRVSAKSGRFYLDEGYGSPPVEITVDALMAKILPVIKKVRKKEKRKTEPPIKRSRYRACQKRDRRVREQISEALAKCGDDLEALRAWEFTSYPKDCKEHLAPTLIKIQLAKTGRT